jgi:hypothetical protein
MTSGACFQRLARKLCSADDITELHGGILIAMFIFLAVGLAVGHVLGRPDRNHSVVLALSTTVAVPYLAWR